MKLRVPTVSGNLPVSTLSMSSLTRSSRKKLETEVEHMLNPQVEVDTLPKDLTDAEDWVSVSQVTAPWDEGACLKYREVTYAHLTNGAAFDFSITDGKWSSG